MFKNILLATMIVLSTTQAWAFTSPWNKLATGTKQVISGPFKLITVPVEQMDGREHDQVLGLLGGLMEGATQTVVVPLKGLFNIVTFPIVDRTYNLSE